ncbi:MAG: 23S rRNA (adenine(2030)-N(6))-methyltransferase RlmJ [Succinivibrio sp.]|nr:23S rRNA (adenine(2030)-N(6))-methyltransferase RlmJ [Succinivibrio sp.]
MLSYRHGFHAGNHADVLKHLTLCLVLRHLNLKDKPYSLIDTHAGAGIYALTSVFAEKTREYRQGYKLIENCQELRALVPEYFEVIDSLPKDEPLYPGSPYFEARLSRTSDKLSLSELHPSDEQALFDCLHQDRRINITRRDGLESLHAILPPTPRRGLCFIDPPYEEENEYYLVIKALKDALRRWETGIYAIWYPVLGRQLDKSKWLVSELKRLHVSALQAELMVTRQDPERGMQGSGLVILNYPYGIESELEKVLNLLYHKLCDEEGKARLVLLNPQP